MKELSIEEKAKAYDEALKVLHKYDGANIMFSQSLKEEMFPELKESEDERVRNKLIDFFKGYSPDEEWWGNITQEDILAWFEKQGEQPKKNDVCNNCDQQGSCVSPCPMKLVEKQGEQPADMVEPKFKVGDWIVAISSGNLFKILSVHNGLYKVLCEDGIETNYPFKEVDKDLRLWTIQDAKDGDVLYINNTVLESIMIYKSFINNGVINKYASYNKFGFEGEHYLSLNDGYIIPATKEQCDLLFQKMKEAGYEWDAEKKELKKIEQNPAWSEEDENNILFLASIIEECFKDKEKITLYSDTVCAHFTKEDVIDRLKSLRPQNRWKPSEEQMKALSIVTCGVNDPLFSLYKDLKKLKE